MNRATLTIAMQGTAFDEPAEELARILEELAAELRRGITTAGPGTKRTLRDVNGNPCGQLVVNGGCRA